MTDDQDKQIKEHLDCLWKLAVTGGMNRKTQEAVKNHLRHIAILRKAEKAAKPATSTPELTCHSN